MRINFSLQIPLSEIGKIKEKREKQILLCDVKEIPIK